MAAQLIYKIVSRDLWAQAEVAGVFEGAAVDLADGFIHFSARHQVEETLAKHFAGQADLLLVAVEAAEFGDELRWEPSRGGDLFPHLYATLDPAQACFVEEIRLDSSGKHQFPELRNE